MYYLFVYRSVGLSVKTRCATSGPSRSALRVFLYIRFLLTCVLCIELVLVARQHQIQSISFVWHLPEIEKWSRPLLTIRRCYPTFFTCLSMLFLCLCLCLCQCICLYQCLFLCVHLHQQLRRCLCLCLCLWSFWVWRRNLLHGMSALDALCHIRGARSTETTACSITTSWLARHKQI